MGLNPGGRDWSGRVNWDDLGKAYAGIIVAWTLILAAGIIWLLSNRRLPYIRMRNLPLAIITTVLLHVYLVKIFFAYTTNGHFTCAAEFWIMSVYLPFGIALFQANGMQLRSVSDQQGVLLQRSLSPVSSSAGLLGGYRVRKFHTSWTSLTETQRGYVYIAAGMLVQMIVTGVLYATSPVLRGDWSSFPPGLPHSEGQARCRRSYAWIPSAFWQLLWAWVFGPYSLYKIRNIYDVHHWRLQTILSVVSGLPGTPLWIAALYSPAFKPVNKWWVPSMWLAPGIIVMQFVTIMFPIYGYFEQAASHRKHSHEHDSRPSCAFGALARPAKSSLTTEELVLNDTKRLFDDLMASGIPAGKSMYRMAALDRALAINPAPLLYFAAKKDFTAENIIFLTHVRDWRGMWRTAPRYPGTKEVVTAAKDQLLKMALRIFRDSVTLTAEFPINIEDSVARGLRDVLGPYQQVDSEPHTNDFTHTPHDMSTFFDIERRSTDHGNITADWIEKKDEFNITVFGSAPLSPGGSPVDTSLAVPGGTKFPSARRDIQYPPGLDEHLFDAAEASILYLVLTNTWRRFVQVHESRHPPT